MFSISGAIVLPDLPLTPDGLVEEFGQLDGDQVTADDDDAVAQRHPVRVAIRTAAVTQPLTPTAHQPGEVRAAPDRCARAGNPAPVTLGKVDLAAGSHHHRVGRRSTTSSNETSWRSTTFAVLRPISPRR